MLSSQQGISIELLQDEGLVQVGDTDIDCDVFIVKVMFKNANNLGQVLNGRGETNFKSFRLNYNLLGSPTQCQLVPKGTNLFSIQEKIAIHFRSSLNSLRKYFDKVFTYQLVCTTMTSLRVMYS